MGDKKWVLFVTVGRELRKSCVGFGCGRRGLGRIPDSAVGRERTEAETEIVRQVWVQSACAAVTRMVTGDGDD